MNKYQIIKIRFHNIHFFIIFLNHKTKNIYSRYDYIIINKYINNYIKYSLKNHLSK
jgi:hypothetical protein